MGVYAQLVGELRELLTAREIAAAAGVAERQVHHWRAGETRPRGAARDRLLELHYLVEALRSSFSPEGVEVFMYGRHRALNGRRPIDLAMEGDYEPLISIVGRLGTDGDRPVACG